ncbi:saccharopine dehydrogenase-like oxidoreductase isoform X1 [Stomoxys calcitrans]|uniref:saccharopine dehydrogenase-like oxidoreductase isoform X1 n=1 Tax=Stomoxys calcitrans TaxID=35570 RepID=UPI0027E36682|nr:saccharopine dehydrogenase-like oxidoreductase isoform X1 [Stomoxys calcitrans]
MEGEKLDAIIFGATGFTGQIVVGDAIDILKDFKWGIAGRNELKLKTLLEDMGQKMQIDLSYIPVVVANVNDQISIETMAQKCKIVINCCGPYQVFGEVVVKACINAGTHHVDLSGEPQFFNGMQLKYDDLAQEKGSYVISNCAFESIPCELGVLYAEKNFPGVINSIELHAVIKPNYQDTSSKAILNYGTWESLICSMQYARELLTLERKLNKEEMPKLTPKLWMRPYPHRTETLSEYFAPFPITDRTVVQRSQRLFYMREQKRPIQFEMYMGFRSFFLALIFPLLLILGVIMAQMSFTRKLLLKYPHTFSRGLMTHQGPTETNRKAAEFSYVVNAKGWSEGTPQTDAPNKVVMVRVSGKDPCYGVTSSCLLTSAKVILQEHQIMPGKGGVLPPGFAFAPTQLLKEMEMCKSGLKFEILKL